MSKRKRGQSDEAPVFRQHTRHKKGRVSTTERAKLAYQMRIAQEMQREIDDVHILNEKKSRAFAERLVREEADMSAKREADSIRKIATNKRKRYEEEDRQRYSSDVGRTMTEYHESEVQDWEKQELEKIAKRRKQTIESRIASAKSASSSRRSERVVDLSHIDDASDKLDEFENIAATDAVRANVREHQKIKWLEKWLNSAKLSPPQRKRLEAAVRLRKQNKWRFESYTALIF